MIMRFTTLALLALSSAAFAHRLDECLQSVLVAIEPTRVCVKINLTPGVSVADEFIAWIDGDRDGMISNKEATAYADVVKADISVSLNESMLDLKLIGSDYPEVSELRNGEGTIRLVFTAAPSSLAPGAHTLALKNRHLPDVSVYLLNAAKSKFETIRITAQKRIRDQHAGTIEFTIDAPADARKRSSSFESPARHLHPIDLPKLSESGTIPQCLSGPKAPEP